MPRPKKIEQGVATLENVHDKAVEEPEKQITYIPPPNMTDPEWNDYVLNQLRQTEKDSEGHPTVFGLRRLVETILGDIIYSCPENLIGAETSNQMRASVIHRVRIRWNDDPDDVREFGAAADVYTGNTDQEFARYAAATADTRAEARALRKALKLKAVAAEEITSLPITESGLGQYIVKSQERGIDKLCKDMDINPMAFINMGQQEYKHFSHVRYTTAQQMLEQLNRYLQNMTKIPDSIKGYDPEWRKSEA